MATVVLPRKKQAVSKLRLLWLCAQRPNILYKSLRLSSIFRILLLKLGNSKRVSDPNFQRKAG